MDEKVLIKNFLQENGIFDLPKEKQLSKLIQLVSNIPWGKGRTIEEVLETKKVGTCTGKHLVLQACFDELGIRYRPVVCTFKWDEQGIDFSEELKDILKLGGWEHGHNFVQVEIKNNDFVDVDITWNSKLTKYGFNVFPQNWNGKDFVGLKKIIKRWNNVDIKDMKEKLIADLSPALRERREHFVKELIRWIDSINKKEE